MSFNSAASNLTGKIGWVFNIVADKVLAPKLARFYTRDDLRLDPLKHVLRNGDLTLEQYLASIGLNGEMEVWAEVEDLNGDAEGDAYLDAVMDAMADEMDFHLRESGDDDSDGPDLDNVTLSMPLPNEKLPMASGGFLDDLGPCDIYTIIERESQTLIGDAILVKNENRWLFEFDLEYMSTLCN